MLVQEVTTTKTAEKIFDLKNSTKDICEHEFVCSYIEEKFQSEGLSYNRKTNKEVITLPHVIHLHSKYEIDSKDKNFETLVRMIHPTPAVCGKQKEVSQKIIKNIEPFDRNYFSGEQE